MQESIAARAIAGLGMVLQFQDFQRPERVLLMIAVAPFRAIASRMLAAFGSTTLGREPRNGKPRISD